MESEHIYEELEPNSQMRTLDVRLDTHSKLFWRRSCNVEESFDLFEEFEKHEKKITMNKHEESNQDMGDVLEKMKQYKRKLAARMSSLVTV